MKNTGESGFTKEEIEKNHKLYEERKKLYASYGYDNEKEREFIINSAGKISGKILEAGTGKGHLALALAKRGICLTTYDVDPETQKFARLNAEYFGLDGKIEFVIEGKETLSFESGSFGVVFCVNTLHHLENTAAVIDELLRVLSPGGKIVLSDFTEKTFTIMDKVHASEGGKHEVVGWSMDKAAGYIRAKGYDIEEKSDDYQRVYIIRKKNI